MGAKNSKSAEDDGGFSDKPDDRDLKQQMTQYVTNLYKTALC